MEPLLFLHGWGGNADSFAPIKNYFARTRPVYTPEFPCPPETVYTLADYARDLLNYLDANQITRCDVVAHSFGARLVAVVNAMRPQLFRRVVITGGAGLPRRSLTTWWKIRWYKLTKLFGNKSGGSADYRALTPNGKITFQNIIHRDLTPEVRKITAPTLVINGNRDRATPLSMARRWVKLSPHATLKVYAGRGHFAYLESASRFIADVGEFLDSAVPPAKPRRLTLKDHGALLQLAHYDSPEQKRLAQKLSRGLNPVPVPQWTPRFKRVWRWSVALIILGFGLPWLGRGAVVRLVNRGLTPGENARNRRFIRQAQQRLMARPDLIRIGVTGSYGKTSVKNILASLLAPRYRVVVSPASFNTPLGLARTVNEQLRPDTQVLILEMGARRPGEIAELCRLFPPGHGIITSIGACHLETFGDLPTVQRTKAELFQALPPDGVAVTDGDNPWCATLTHPNLIKVSGNKFPYQTALLGAHQHKNILLAVALARRLGVTEPELTRAIADLKPTPHRLEKIVAPNGIIILDDSYNANPESATVALAVLKTFPGKKVVQTPGFVEQGSNTAGAHATLCQQIRAVADAVIIVGAVNRADLMAGFAGWDRPVLTVPNRDTAKAEYARLLRSGDVLLLLNDLPENY